MADLRKKVAAVPRRQTENLLPQDAVRGPRPAVGQSAREVGVLGNLLLIDDSEADVELARMLLELPLGMQCNFLVAGNGEEGLARIRDQAIRNDPVDFIIADINMPVLGGLQMLEAMRENAAYAGIPVLICSGSIGLDERSRAVALGAAGCFIKPIRYEELEPIIAATDGLRLSLDADGRRSLIRTR